MQQLVKPDLHDFSGFHLFFMIFSVMLNGLPFFQDDFITGSIQQNLLFFGQSRCGFKCNGHFASLRTLADLHMSLRKIFCAVFPGIRGREKRFSSKSVIRI